jgi:hypothetical protein
VALHFKLAHKSFGCTLEYKVSTAIHYKDPYNTAIKNANHFIESSELFCGSLSIDHIFKANKEMKKNLKKNHKLENKYWVLEHRD